MCYPGYFEGKEPVLIEREYWADRRPARPVIVCLVGSTRFREAFDEANAEQTLAGKIVLQPGHYTHAEAERQGAVNRAAGNSRPVAGDKEVYFGPEVAAQLMALYRHKIELADEVLVINPGGYIGESTRDELAFAAELGKPIYYLVRPKLADDYSDDDDLVREHGSH